MSCRQVTRLCFPEHHEAGHPHPQGRVRPCCVVMRQTMLLRASNASVARNYFPARLPPSSETVTISLLMAEVLFWPDFQPADSTAPRSRTTCNATTCTSCRVVKRRDGGLSA